MSTQNLFNSCRPVGDIIECKHWRLIDLNSFLPKGTSTLGCFKKTRGRVLALVSPKLFRTTSACG